MSFSRNILAAAIVAWSGAVSAAPLLPTSYDLRNGDGQASGGSFNYWDLAYSGAGATTVDGASLSGGLGDLTDGVIATQNWFNVENAGGTGPYLGWYRCPTPACVPDPVVTFRFTPGTLETFVFNSVTLHLDDANGAGGVQLPAAISVSIDGAPAITQVVSDPVGADPLAVTIDLGGTPGEEVLIQLFHKDGWVFLSEVEFAGDIIIRDDFGVPAPASLALLGAGLIGLAGLRRR